MKKISAQKKGDDLEESVAFLEEIFLMDEFRGLSKAKIRISPKKRIIGGRHEIDLLIEINPDSDYSSLFLIECKNWKKSVGTPEVSKLQTKITDSKAQRGIIFAKKFTKLAVEQAKDYSIDLIKVSDNLNPLFSTPLIEYWDMEGYFLTVKLDGNRIIDENISNQILNLKSGKGISLLNHIKNLYDTKQEKIISSALKFINNNYEGDKYYLVTGEILKQDIKIRNQISNTNHNKLQVYITLKIWFSYSKYSYSFDFNKRGRTIIKHELAQKDGSKAPVLINLKI